MYFLRRKYTFNNVIFINHKPEKFWKKKTKDLSKILLSECNGKLRGILCRYELKHHANSTEKKGISLNSDNDQADHMSELNKMMLYFVS